ncbi:MAG: MoaD/ThiS family protein [Ignavibacteriaceae bacterium]
MRTIVYIPSPFLELTGRTRVVKIEGNTAGEVLDNLTQTFFPLRKHIYSDNGRLRSVVNVYVNEEDIKFLQDENTILKEDDVIKIIPTIAGGSQD